MPDSLRTCPHCSGEVAAEAVFCPHCGTRLDRREPEAAVYDYPPPILTLPIVVSAGWNLVTAAGWAFFVPCFGLFIAVPYVALAYFEIVTFTRAPAMSPRELHKRCGVLGAFQILLGLTNVVPVICGVLLLVYRDRLLEYRGPVEG
jgi:hypothetical protein